MNVTYISILNVIEAFAAEHLEIKRFASDFSEQMPNFGTEKETYPVLFVSPSNVQFNENTNTFNLTVYSFDIIQKDRSNISTILSVTNNILHDLFLWFKDGDIYGIDLIETTPNVQPLNNALLDYAAGWQMEITLEVNPSNICEIPFNNAPVVITEVCDVVYSQYLTCETLEDCPVILEIQGDIDALELLSPTQDEKDAMDAANSPSIANPFATINDLSGPIVVPTLSQVLTAGDDATGQSIQNINDITAGTGLINVGNKQLWASGIVVLDWRLRRLFDTSSAIAINWGTRQLLTSGSSILNWSTRSLQQNEWHYDADYSASYTNRSLVDKQYVVNAIAAIPTPPASDLISVLTAGNSTGDISIVSPDTFSALGIADGSALVGYDDGTLLSYFASTPLQARMLYSDGSIGGDISIFNNRMRIVHSLTIQLDSPNLEWTSDSGGYAQAYFYGDSSQFTLGYNLNTIMVSDTAMTVTAPATGIEYAADYSAGYTNRTLVDKEYVDNAIPSTPNLAAVLAVGNLTNSIAITSNDTTSSIDWNNGSLTILGTVVTLNGLTIGKGASNIATNTAFGIDALDAITTGSSNVGIGYETLMSNQATVGNVAIGRGALKNHNQFDGNTAIGYNALTAQTSGQFNVAIGFNAMPSNLTGNGNLALGTNALASSTNGSDNTAIGYAALISMTGGTDNVAIGKFAMVNATSGPAQNTVIGDNAGAYIISQANNTIIGYNAGGGAFTGGDCTIIGRGMNLPATGDGQLVLGANGIRHIYGAATGDITLVSLAGIGSRMVVASATGVLSTTAIPATPTLASVLAAGNTTNEIVITSNNGNSDIYALDAYAMFRYTTGSVVSSITMDGAGPVMDYTNGVVSGAIRITSAQTQLSHSTLLNLDSSVVRFNGLTASTFMYLDASKNAVSLANGTGFLTNNGSGTFSYTAASTTNIAEGTNLYFTNARAIAATLTGYTSGAGTVSAADSILSAIQKLNGNTTALSSSTTYVGTTAVALNRASANQSLTGITDITFPGTASPSYAAGKLVYDTDNQSLTFYNNEADVSLQIGQESWVRVYNTTGSTITNGTAVYINGTDGGTGLPTIAKAKGDAAATVICAGLATHDIETGSIGYITNIGVVHGMDTSGFVAGATVFVSAATAGLLTSTAPTSPNYRYRVGIVTKSHATTGTVLVTPSTAAIGNGTAGQYLQIGSGGTQQFATITEYVGGTMDGQGGVIANNSKFTIVVPFTGTIVGWTLLEVSDTPITSTVTLDAWKDSYANYPPTVADTIFGTKPALASAIKNQATGLSIAVTAGDIIIVNADSISLANKLKFGFNITRS